MNNKFLSRLSSFALLGMFFFGAFPYAHAAGDVESSKIEISDSLKERERMAVSKLAERCGLEEDYLKSALTFNLPEKSKFFGQSCRLVPVYDCREHKECFLRVFSYARPEYMKYYLNGRLKAPDDVEAWFNRAVRNINADSPNSVTFLIKVGDNVVGRIGIGPLVDRKEEEMEIGYAIDEAYSGQGITARAVDSALSFLKVLRENGKDCYNFTRLRATAKFDNVASNRILRTRGFVLSSEPTDDGCGPENEYYYYFI